MADAKKNKVRVLRVSSRPDTFRRVGRTFTRDPQDIPLSELDKEEIKAIKAERLLAVEELDVEVAAAPEGDAQ